MGIRFVASPPNVDGEVVFETTIYSLYNKQRTLVDGLMDLLVARRLIEQDDFFKVRICLDEATVNAIKHGNKEDPTKQVRVALYAKPDAWCVIVEDEGGGFSLDDVPDQNDPASLEMDHGRGVHIMREMMDELLYWDSGSKLMLIKKKDPMQGNKDDV